MNKELLQSIEEGKRFFFEGQWYKKTDGKAVKEKTVKKAFEINKCPLCNKDILTEKDRNSFIAWGCCLSCYYHKKRNENKE